MKRVAVAEVQRAMAVAVAESRANERLRVHRLLDLPLSQRNHGALRQGPFLRVHGNAGALENNARTVTPTTTSNSALSTTDDEKDSHLQSISGSVSVTASRSSLLSRCSIESLPELLELRKTRFGDLRRLRDSAILRILLPAPRLGGRRAPRDLQQPFATGAQKILVP